MTNSRSHRSFVSASRSHHVGTADLRRRRRTRRLMAGAVAAAVAAAAGIANADGNFDGGQVSLTQTRQWIAPGPVPGINWNLDTLPLPADPLAFAECGDGRVDLMGMLHAHPEMKIADWVTYDWFNGALEINGAAAAINVGASVDTTYGSAYFADGNTIGADLSLTSPLTINFHHVNSGALRLSGRLSGNANLTVVRAPAGANVRSLYIEQDNAAYAGNVSITTGTAVRLLEAGRTGTGMINLDGGDLDILSEAPGGQILTNSVFSAMGRIRAERNYTLNPMPPTPPTLATHVIRDITIDNPAMLGGSNDAYIEFAADSGYNFTTRRMVLGNAGVAAPGSRTVIVNNGSHFDGTAGSRRLTGPNRLGETLVTTTVSSGAGNPSFFDIDPIIQGGHTLFKRGTGVLVIDGDNQTTSMGRKIIDEGVISFSTPLSYGTTNGLAGGPAVPVLLRGGPAPVSAGMGVGYVTPVPGNLLTTGTIPGQSGAIDIDVTPNPAAIALSIVNTAGTNTALRIGSSGRGVQTGPILPFVNFAAGEGFYFLGGGGGELEIATPLGPAPGANRTVVEMGTTGQLLPGRVNLTAPINGGGTIRTHIRAGTLAALPPGVLANQAFTSLGAYSTALSTASYYAAAPASTPYDGPGQLLLDHVAHNNGLYNYGAGGSFGAAPLLLDGGAIGWTGDVSLNAPPGTYNMPLSSTLYQSAAAPSAPLLTNVLHLGGEHSAGTMIANFPISDNFNTPVALLKSGVNSTLDLTPLPVHPFSGGLGIMGGVVITNFPEQLGRNTVTIDDGGELSIVAPPPGAGLTFPQMLRVANGVERRSSVVRVAMGQLASFVGATSPIGAPLEADPSAPGSLLEKQGPGQLNLYMTAFNAANYASPTNTWGIKTSDGIVSLNHLPGNATPFNGQAVFNGGVMEVVSPTGPGGIIIPPPVLFDPNYGFAALSSYAGTKSELRLGDQALFHTTGAQRGDWMGRLHVSMGANSIFKLAANVFGAPLDTRGTGQITFDGRGAVQFTPFPGGGQILYPRDGGFTTALDNGVLFSGTREADINGNLLFNSSGGAGGVVFIDGAIVGAGAPPPVAASTWTIGGTGLTSWNGTVIKWQTEGIPGAGGPFVSGTVSFNRCEGAPVIVQPGSTLRIEFGVVNAGNTADPFTDNSGLATTGNHVNVENNASGPGVGVPPARAFNITQGTKRVGDLTVSGFNPVAPALGVSATSVYPGARLEANHIRQNRLDINAAAVAMTYVNGGAGGTSRIRTLNIDPAGGAMDLNDNDLIVTGGTLATITGQIKTGLENGGAFDWLGPGIRSTEANVRNTAAGSFLYGLGVILNDLAQVGGVGPIYANFSGQATSGITDVLVKFTYFGDADLSGAIDATDYSLIDNGYVNGLSGWINGDFDYSGVIDATDYALIDNAYVNQSGVLAEAMIARHTKLFSGEYLAALRAVRAGIIPEPLSIWACIAPLLIAAGASPRRRSGRKQLPKRLPTP